eukprot:SAG22_NODE_289_length_12942_cov_6.674531_8_plen_554_part_00
MLPAAVVAAYVLPLAAAAAGASGEPAAVLAPITAAQLQRRVDAAIDNGAPSVDVPGGAYLFNSSGGTDFLILGASKLEIRALAPVTLWFAGGAGVNITDSTDVQLVGSSGGGGPGAGRAGWILDYDPPATAQVKAGSTLNLLNCTRVLAEDVTIRAAPYMAVTAWNGGGAHVFRRLTFELLPFGPTQRNESRPKVGLRDATHFSDQRVGPTIEDSIIGFTGDDFFNVHTTLMVVLRCETPKSCLVINPHLFVDIPRNTAYGTNSVMGTVLPGDKMSFFGWPQADMRASKQGGPLSVASTEEVTDPELLAEAATLVPELAGDAAAAAAADSGGGLVGAGSASRGASGGWTQFTNKTVGWNAKELWRVHFESAVPAGVGRAGIITIDTISNAGAKIINTHFINTTCNLGRLKSSNALIQGCTFENARIPNLEITYLPQFFEGPVTISNVTLADNLFLGDGPSPIHCGPLCEVRASCLLLCDFLISLVRQASFSMHDTSPSPCMQMAGCQDICDPPSSNLKCQGTWVKHHCTACPSCDADTPWVTGVTLRNNSIVE